MATKGKAKETVNEVVTEETVKEAVNETAPQREKMVTIRIPRERGDKETHMFISVNERTFLVEKGKPVEVPECVAEVLKLREAALEEAYEFEQENVKG